jgi:hypothetical protein
VVKAAGLSRTSAKSASIAATDSRSRHDPLARHALFVAFEGMGLLDLTGPLTVFCTANPLAPLARSQKAPRFPASGRSCR